MAKNFFVSLYNFTLDFLLTYFHSISFLSPHNFPFPTCPPFSRFSILFLVVFIHYLFLPFYPFLFLFLPPPPPSPSNFFFPASRAFHEFNKLFSYNLFSSLGKYQDGEKTRIQIQTWRKCGFETDINVIQIWKISEINTVFFAIFSKL